MSDSDPRVVAITGGSKGIGRCIAFKFAEEKAKVIILHFDPDEIAINNTLEALSDKGVEAESSTRKSVKCNGIVVFPSLNTAGHMISKEFLGIPPTATLYGSLVMIVISSNPIFKTYPTNRILSYALPRSIAISFSRKSFNNLNGLFWLTADSKKSSILVLLKIRYKHLF